VPFQFTCFHYFTYSSGLKFEILDDGAIHTKSMAGYAEGPCMTAAVSTSGHGVTDCFEIIVLTAGERWSTAL